MLNAAMQHCGSVVVSPTSQSISNQSSCLHQEPSLTRKKARNKIQADLKTDYLPHYSAEAELCGCYSFNYMLAFSGEDQRSYFSKYQLVFHQTVVVTSSFSDMLCLQEGGASDGAHWHNFVAFNYYFVLLGGFRGWRLGMIRQSTGPAAITHTSSRWRHKAGMQQELWTCSPIKATVTQLRTSLFNHQEIEMQRKSPLQFKRRSCNDSAEQDPKVKKQL